MSAHENSDNNIGGPVKIGQHTLRFLELKDSRKAALTLLGSFDDDHLATYLVSHVEDPDVRAKLCLALYEAYTRQHILNGIVLGINETDDAFETVAIWAHPTALEDGLESYSTMMEAGYSTVWEMNDKTGRKKVFTEMMGALHDTAERILNFDERFMNKGVYTLVYLGSLRSARGKGNVRFMFEYMFRNYIDTKPDSITYLESSSINNIPVYEKFGFRLHSELTVGKRTPGSSVEGQDYAKLYVMIRGYKGRDWSKEDTNVHLHF